MLTELPGTLSKFPREVRDKIYGLALNFNPPNFLPPPGHPRIRLLQVSHRIHDEAEKALYNTNSFLIKVDTDHTPRNISVMGTRGFSIRVAPFNETGTRHYSYDTLLGISDQRMPPLQMLRHVQIWGIDIRASSSSVVVGRNATTHPIYFGPEHPTFKPLSVAIEEGCAILRQCHHVHKLAIYLESNEHTSSSLEFLMKPIARLRSVKEIHVFATSYTGPDYINWQLKAGYGRYLARIMALSEAAETPDYVRDDEDEVEETPGIFKIHSRRRTQRR